MNKLCCCAEPELPDISVSFNCACCDSRVERRTDIHDFDMAVKETSDHLQEQQQDDEEEKKDEEDDEITYCCCFPRKRHAKSKKSKKKRHDGGKT